MPVAGSSLRALLFSSPCESPPNPQTSPFQRGLTPLLGLGLAIVGSCPSIPYVMTLSILRPSSRFSPPTPKGCISRFCCEIPGAKVILVRANLLPKQRPQDLWPPSRGALRVGEGEGSAAPPSRCARTCRPPGAGQSGTGAVRRARAPDGRRGRVRASYVGAASPARRGWTRESAPCAAGVWEGRVPARRARPLPAAARGHAVRRSPRAAGGGASPPARGPRQPGRLLPCAGVGERGGERARGWFAAAAAAAEEAEAAEAEQRPSAAAGAARGGRGGGGGGVGGARGPRRRRGGGRWRTCSASCDSTTSRRRRSW